MRLEGVITCVNYADFLDHALARNLHHFDDLVVVTIHEDQATQSLCAFHGVKCVMTDIFHEDGDAFNKGRAINLGLEYLRRTDWVLHLDADILLPDRFRSMLGKSGLQPGVLYGADRIMVTNKWQLKELERSRQYHHYMVECHGQIGARIVHDDLGYCPIGYFQLWHGSQRKKYPTNSGNAAQSDLLFACQWPRTQRQLLPTVLVHHLESAAGMGANWNGRTTPPFGYYT